MGAGTNSNGLSRGGLAREVRSLGTGYDACCVCGCYGLRMSWEEPMSTPAKGRNSIHDDPHAEAVRFGGSISEKEKPTRKNHYLYQSKIDMAKEILGVKTETEALDGALDLLIYGEALARGTEDMEKEEYHDVLGIAGEVPGTRTGA